MQEIARGLGASAGVYTGQVRVVPSIDELSMLEEGEILVVRSSNPAWTVGMLKSGALITELGGVICHAAIVAREIGIPAIVAVGDATNILATGQHVQVDGTSGLIYAMP